MTAAQGAYSQLGIDTAATVTKRYDFQNEGVKAVSEHIDMNGLRGKRTRHMSRNKTNLTRVGGTIMFIPTATEWTSLLPWVMGGAGTPTGGATVFDPNQMLLPDRYVVIDRVTKVSSYDGCKVDRATIRSSQGTALELDLDIVGKTEVVANAGTFPVLPLDTGTQPFIFSEAIILVGGTPLYARDIEITLENMIDRDRFFNSQTITEVNAQDLLVTYRTTVPYSDGAAVYGDDDDGVVIKITFTDGTRSLVIDLPCVAVIKDSPNMEGHSEGMMSLSGRAFANDASPEIRITIDNT